MLIKEFFVFSKTIILVAVLYFYSSVANSSMYDVFDSEDRPVATIVGTVHSFDIYDSKRAGDKQFWKKTAQTLLACKKAFVEHQGLKQADLFVRFTQMHAKDVGITEEAQKFSNIFSIEEREKIIRKLEKSSLNADGYITNKIIPILDIIRPWYISALLATSPQMSPEQSKLFIQKTEVDGMDALIVCGLKAEQKAVFSLETLESLMSSVYNNLPEDTEVIKWIRHSISQEYFDVGMDMQPPYGEDEEAWKAFMNKFPKQPDSPLSNDAVHVARNELWADVLDKEFKLGGNDKFIAVGIAHLYGGRNLLELLQVKGYKIKRTS
jgi:uncharacterized protein YbaP (TraB family)